MRTIVEPVKSIDDLWGKQAIKENITYRMMRYVLRVDHEGKVLLHNAITGQLVVLDQVEAQIVDKSPTTYVPDMKALVTNHYLVPEDYDEHQQVDNLRSILRKLEESQRRRSIRKYTILPTTACNARCYYCFEQGFQVATMTEHRAEDVVKFISSHSDKDEIIRITWFGGEPTVAADRIDQISTGLRENNVRFYSDMTSNGYLFNEQMALKAKSLWNLTYIQICFDGLEAKHNDVKNYSNAKDNPFERTLRNIGLLLDQGIRVGMRMNFDLSNYQDFEGLINEAIRRYGKNPALSIYAFPVIGEHKNREGRVTHGSNDWFISTIPKLNSISRESGTYHERHILPHLEYHCCDAENKRAITIIPDGSLVRCCQCIDKDQIVGTIWDGIHEDSEVYKSWNQYADYPKCKDCAYYPYCCRVECCSAQDRCLFYAEWANRNRRTIVETFARVN